MAILSPENELSTDLLLKLSSFMFWCSVYLYCSSRAPAQSAEYCSRVVTLLHGSVATVVGLQQCGVSSLSLNRFVGKTLSRHYALMLWSWGYFAFDLMWCVVSWTESALMLCHHCCALAAITMYMNKPYSGCTFGCSIAMLECTNPLLQTRWLLRNEGQDTTKLYYTIEILYLVAFIMIRGVIGSYAVYKILKSDMFATDEKAMAVIFYVVSILFIHEILGYISYKYKQKVQEYRENTINYISTKINYLFGRN
ncbi:hypothetical protein JYU34_009023 [Plutella xylostella]|uniref:TLC domain-containing protein n=2 Tax=Plutella xylostella TaxID=51655 RepID=A0ABQ7QMV1_PLUXY|nr:hypothetical protein JYU34_009023 [Plutella xylostella]